MKRQKKDAKKYILDFLQLFFFYNFTENSAKIDKKETELKEIISKEARSQEEPEDTEIEIFSYKLGEKILNFQFISEKRVKSPGCKKDFKNILGHFKQSKQCGIWDYDDFSENLKLFTKINRSKELKENQRKRKVKSRMHQREDNLQKVLDDQNRWKAESISKQRARDPLKVQVDQKKRKESSRVTQRDIDNLKVLDNQKKWKA